MWSCLIPLDTPAVTEKSYSHYTKQKDSIFGQVLYMKPMVEIEMKTQLGNCHVVPQREYYTIFPMKVDNKLINKKTLYTTRAPLL